MADYDISNLRVLIVDDYQPMRQIMRQILKEWGVRSIREGLDVEEKFSEGVGVIVESLRRATQRPQPLPTLGFRRYGAGRRSSPRRL